MRVLNLGVSKKLLLAAVSMAFAVFVLCAPSFAFANGELGEQRADAEIARDAFVSNDLESIVGAVEPIVDVVDASAGVATGATVEDVVSGDQADPGAPAEDAGETDAVVENANAAVDDAVVEGAADEATGNAAVDKDPAAQEKEEQAAAPADKVPAPANKDVVSDSQVVKTETKPKASSSKVGSNGSDDIALKPQSSYTTVSIPKVHNYTYDGNYHCPFACGNNDDYCNLYSSKYDYDYWYDYDEGVYERVYEYYGDCWHPDDHYIHEYLPGSYRVTVSLLPGCRWSDGTIEDKILTWRINPIVIPLPVAKTGLVYNGKYQRGIANSKYYDCITDTHKNSGTYYETVYLAEYGYVWKDGTDGPKTIKWSIAKKRVPLPVAKKGLTYSGKSQYGIDVKSYYANSHGQPMKALAKKLPGTYSERVYLVKNYEWADGTTGSKLIKWKIAPLGELTKPTKKNLKFASLSFNGKRQRVNQKSLNKHISSTGLTAYAPGLHTAVLKPKAGYLWSDGTSGKVRLSWRMLKAKASSVKVKFPYFVYRYDSQGNKEYGPPDTKYTSEYICMRYSSKPVTPEFDLFIGNACLGGVDFDRDFFCLDKDGWEDEHSYHAVMKRYSYSGNNRSGSAVISIKLNNKYFAGSDPVVKKTFAILPSGASGWVGANGKWYYVGDYYGPWYYSSYWGGWTYDYEGSIYPGEGEDAMGWKEIEGTWYFFSRDTYAMTTGLFRDKGKTYYCASSGAMQTNCWKKVGKSWYYFGKSGAAYTGRHKIGGVWYKFDSRGKML